MHMTRFLAFLLGTLILWVVPVQASDLTKIDRTIAKEPTYKSKPRYCLLVFGPQAKFRVWLVIDGSTLYVDRNGNGDLTEPGERATWNEPYSRWESDIRGPDGKSRCALSMRKFPEAKSGAQLSVHEEGQRTYIVGDPDADVLVFADRPSEAPVAHIGGPLSIHLRYGLDIGSLRLRVRVGTPGLGRGAFAGLVLEGVAPVAEIELPSKNRGGPPILTKATLKNR